MKVKENESHLPLVLTDQDLIRVRTSLLGIGSLRRAVVGEGPGTSADLKRLSHDMQALGDLAQLLASLETNGAVYTHGRDVYLYFRPVRDLFDVNRRSLLEFVLHLPTFQEWIDAQEQMVVTRATTQPAS